MFSLSLRKDCSITCMSSYTLYLYAFHAGYTSGCTDSVFYAPAVKLYLTYDFAEEIYFSPYKNKGQASTEFPNVAIRKICSNSNCTILLSSIMQ